jgi:hypothetical protein
LTRSLDHVIVTPQQADSAESGALLGIDCHSSEEARSMSISRRLVALTVLAVSLPVATATALSAGPAFAGGVPVNGTGFVDCTSVTGSVKFSPGLNSTGGSGDAITVKLALGGCSATGSNVTTSTFTGKAKGTLVTASNSCSSLEGTPSVTGILSIKWAAKAGASKVNPTVMGLTSITVAASNGTSDVQVGFVDQSSTGSFNSPITGQFTSNETGNSAAGSNGCGGAKGLRKLPIASGSLASQANVLTVGGRNVSVGDVLSANATAGPDGSLDGSTCSGGSVRAVVQDNPLTSLSSFGAATLQLTNVSLGACFERGIGPYSPPILNLPAQMFLSDDATQDAAVTGLELGSTPAGCVWGGTLEGNFSNTTNSASVQNPALTVLPNSTVSGCDTNIGLSLAIGPLVDTSVNPNEVVTVNQA